MAAVGLSSVNFLQKGTVAADASGSSKTVDGTSNTKSTVAANEFSQAANDSQATHSLQGDGSKVAVGTAVTRVTENGAAPSSMQALASSAVAHGAATFPHAAAAMPDAANAGKAQNLAASAHVAGEDAVQASGINSAKLIQTMGETEMHVGMHSVEFGDISIRTSLSQQQMVTQISLEHNDLSQMISSHLSTVQAKLGEEYGLHASIQVNSQGAPMSGGRGTRRRGINHRPGVPAAQWAWGLLSFARVFQVL